MQKSRARQTNYNTRGELIGCPIYSSSYSTAKGARYRLELLQQNRARLTGLMLSRERYRFALIIHKGSSGRGWNSWIIRGRGIASLLLADGGEEVAKISAGCSGKVLASLTARVKRKIYSMTEAEVEGLKREPNVRIVCLVCRRVINNNRLTPLILRVNGNGVHNLYIECLLQLKSHVLDGPTALLLYN